MKVDTQGINLLKCALSIPALILPLGFIKVLGLRVFFCCCYHCYFFFSEALELSLSYCYQSEGEGIFKSLGHHLTRV